MINRVTGMKFVNRCPMLHQYTLSSVCVWRRKVCILRVAIRCVEKEVMGRRQGISQFWPLMEVKKSLS